MRPIYECVFKETYAETDPDGGGPGAPRPVQPDDALGSVLLEVWY